MHTEDKSNRDDSEPTCADLGCADRLNSINETPRDVKDIAAIAIPVDECYVAEWSERPKSRPSQVHIVLTVEDAGPSVAIALRLKSKRATSQLIVALRKHRDLVWP